MQLFGGIMQMPRGERCKFRRHAPIGYLVIWLRACAPFVRQKIFLQRAVRTTALSPDMDRLPSPDLTELVSQSACSHKCGGTLSGRVESEINRMQNMWIFN